MTSMRKIVLLSAALAALGLATQAPAANTQQERMKTCSAQAKSQSLSGDERRSYMKHCLSGEETSGKALNGQQRKMQTCNAEAKSKGLKGTERKQYMSTCLKGT